MIAHYRIVLDSGYWWPGSYFSREVAHYAAQKHNVEARKQKERGDLVSLRRAIGVVKIIPKPTKLTETRQEKKAR